MIEVTAFCYRVVEGAATYGLRVSVSGEEVNLYNISAGDLVDLDSIRLTLARAGILLPDAKEWRWHQRVFRAAGARPNECAGCTLCGAA